MPKTFFDFPDVWFWRSMWIGFATVSRPWEALKGTISSASSNNWVLWMVAISEEVHSPKHPYGCWPWHWMGPIKSMPMTLSNAKVSPSISITSSENILTCLLYLPQIFLITLSGNEPTSHLQLEFMKNQWGRDNFESGLCVWFWFWFWFWHSFTL